ncbi:MAG: hypothetical protein HYV63_24455 [Candidatus Schekmanbacteria bacterium]|nr:hypothetical protein [Candidatus Schekmanbacteria bacterium]
MSVTRKRKWAWIGAGVMSFLLGCGSADKVSGPGGDDEPGTRPVLMLGRSVMAGWFAHWGSDTSSAVSFAGRTLHYGSLDSPPGIADSGCGYVDGVEASEGWLVFFKLCFEDFAGGTREEAEANLSANKAYVDQVVSCARNRGISLLLGNALPKVAADTDAELVWNHEEYNAYLRQLDEAADDVRVVDLYGRLANSAGELRSDYSVDPYDSHLKDAAYRSLDGELSGAMD